MKPMKAFRSESPSMSAMMSVNYSKEITSTKKNDFNKTKRPSELPPAETLYDELQIARKEISTQKKVITQQKTRNDRLESDLKKREAQMEEILAGTGSKSTKNDQLRARILRLERELRHKDLELGKALFDMKNTDINELKMAVEIYATEVDRLRKISADQMHLTEVSRQKERKTQISQLKKALAALGKEKEVLQLENEKYQTQLDSLRDSKLDGQIKQKKEIDHLRNELRKARISNPKSVEAREASKKETKTDNKLEKLSAENEHLKSKIDIMAGEAREMQKLIDTKSSKNIDNEKFENVTNELQTEIDDKTKEIIFLKSKIQKLEEREELAKMEAIEMSAKNSKESNINSKRDVMESVSRRSSISSVKSMSVTEEAGIIGAITGHIYRTDAIST